MRTGFGATPSAKRPQFNDFGLFIFDDIYETLGERGVSGSEFLSTLPFADSVMACSLFS
jgi:hypothetical protein